MFTSRPLEPALTLSDAAPEPLGVADPGVDTQASRSDHVHLMPSAGDVGALPAATTASDIGGIAKTEGKRWLPVCDYASTDLGVDTEVGGVAIDPSALAIAGMTASLVFAFEGVVSAPGVTGRVELYDEDDAALAVGLDITLDTFPMNTHSGAVALPAVRHRYSLRFRLSAGAAPDYAILRNAVIIVSYA